MLDAVGYFAYQIFLGIWPFVGIILLARISWAMWIHYIQQDFISGIDYVLLEIVPPRDVLRSPKAMELFFTNALYHFSMKGGLEAYWQGAVWLWFSLEIVSIDGQVHFYIRTPSRLKDMVETQMYAQYPQAQVKVVEDYTLAVDKITPEGDWNLWGCEFALEKADAFPIKTYVDFGLDKDPKEEFKVDPISPVVELFGSIQKGEQMWLQIVITPSKKEYHTKGTWFRNHGWFEEAENVMKDLSKEYTKVSDTGVKEIRAPKWLDPVLDAISKKTTKIAFDTGIRVCYVAKKEAFNANSKRNLRLVFRQYANPQLNGFTRLNSTAADAYGGVFSVGKKTVIRLSNRMLNEYRERSFVHSSLRQQLFSKDNIPWPISPMIFPAYVVNSLMVLNVEELATIWHFPGQILKVPTLERIESKQAAPPTNLPT